MTVSNYTTCNVIGSGKLNRDVSFKIIDLSAEKIRIKTDAPIEIKSNVSLDIILDDYIFEIHIKTNGIVSNKIDTGYEVMLTDLSEDDRTVIDELMRSSSDVV